jgi:hypothetical protein
MHSVRLLNHRPSCALVLLLGLVAAPSSALAFANVTLSYGVANGQRMSYGGSFVDFDGDGDHDLYASNHWQYVSQLYRNDGGAPLLEHFGVYSGARDRHDSIWADLNGDGAPDQYVLHGAGQSSELHWNRGYGLFEEGGGAAGVQDTDGRGREATAADFDADGDLDLFVVNEYRPGFTHPTILYWNQGDETFQAAPNGHDLFRSRLHCASTDYNLDGYPDIVVTVPFYANGELWRNNGDGTWTDVTNIAFPGISLPLKQAQGLSWADYDNDGDPDLLACGGNWAIFDYAALESDSVRFHSWCDTTETKGVTLTTSADSVTLFVQASDFQPVTCHFPGGDTTRTFPVTVAVDDIAGEPPTLLDGVVGVRMWSTAGAEFDTVRFDACACSTRSLVVGGSLRTGDAGIEEWWTVDFEPRHAATYADWKNRLYRNEGNGTFVEMTSTAFVVNDSTMNTAGAAWGDYDNDGWIDVYLTNAGTIETLNEPNWLFRNNGDGSFKEVGASQGLQGATWGLGDGAAWGDVNNDGFLDLFVDNGGEFPPFGIGERELYLNPGNGNHWLELTLRGVTSNPSGIGARVRVVTASGVRWGSMSGDSDNCYGSFFGVHVGLAGDSVADTVQIFWPSGQEDVHESVAGDTHYYAIEGQALRVMANPELELSQVAIVDSLSAYGSRPYTIGMESVGGAAVQYAFSVEDCEGLPAEWLEVLGEQTGHLYPAKVDSFVVRADFSGLPPGSYCGRVIISSNSVTGPDTVTVTIDVGEELVGAPPVHAPRGRFQLSPPRPNPTHRGVSLVLSLPAPAVVEVEIVDVAGRRTRTLQSGALPPGTHRLSWDGRDEAGRRVGPGVYLVQARCGAERIVHKVVLLD